MGADRPRLMRALRNSHGDFGTPPDRIASWAWLVAEAHNDPVLTVLYEEYVSKVSEPAMAISLEAAQALALMCGKLKPRRILDLGSGFSSLVFRRYASSTKDPITVVSVDDNQFWLQQTRDYLAEQGYREGSVQHWRDFRFSQHDAFDLVLHDLGNMRTRAETLTHAIGRTATTGTLFVDDVHKRVYRRRVKKVARSQAMQIVSLREQTLDSYQRFAALLLPQSS